MAARSVARARYTRLVLNISPRGAIGFRLAHELEGFLTGIAADGVQH